MLSNLHLKEIPHKAGSSIYILLFHLSHVALLHLQFNRLPNAESYEHKKYQLCDIAIEYKTMMSQLNSRDVFCKNRGKT